MTKLKKEFNLATDGAELQKLIKEASNVKTQIELYQGTIKDIRDRAVEELGVKPKMFNSVLKMYFKQNRNEIENENETSLEIYDSLFKPKANNENI